MHHFVTEKCTHVHISVTKWCIVGYGTDAFWNLWDGSMGSGRKSQCPPADKNFRFYHSIGPRLSAASIVTKACPIIQLISRYPLILAKPLQHIWICVCVDFIYPYPIFKWVFVISLLTPSSLRNSSTKAGHFQSEDHLSVYWMIDWLYGFNDAFPPQKGDILQHSNHNDTTLKKVTLNEFTKDLTLKQKSSWNRITSYNNVTDRQKVGILIDVVEFNHKLLNSVALKWNRARVTWNDLTPNNIGLCLSR